MGLVESLEVTGWLIISRLAASCGKRLDGTKIALHQRLDVGKACGLRPRRHEIAAEDRRQRVPVGQVEITECGDRDVKLHGVDTLAEVAVARAPLEHFA